MRRISLREAWASRWPARPGSGATVLARGTAVSVWALAPSLFVLGLGMGACFSSIYDVAIGDVAADEAGSASGALSAVQQLVAVVAGIAALGLGLVWLLPRSAPADAH